MHYGTTANANPITMAISATHPANYATYSFLLIRGINPVPVVGTASGPVPSPAAPLTVAVAAALGSCNIAGFAEYLYVATTIQNGSAHQSQYDASAAFAFVLAP